MVRSLPENTVEAWVAMAVAATFPNARIWSPAPPNQRSGWEQAADLGEGTSFIFENKATELVKPGNDHVIEINRAQLDRYCDLSAQYQQSPIYYLLPDPPWFAIPRQGTPVPVEAAHRIAPVPFKEWAWVVPCEELRDYLRGAHSIRTSVLPRRGWSTLASFLKEVKERRAGNRSEADLAGEPHGSESSTGRESRSRDTLMAVFVPSVDLPNWRPEEPSS